MSCAFVNASGTDRQKLSSSTSRRARSRSCAMSVVNARMSPRMPWRTVMRVASAAQCAQVRMRRSGLRIAIPAHSLVCSCAVAAHGFRKKLSPFSLNLISSSITVSSGTFDWSTGPRSDGGPSSESRSVNRSGSSANCRLSTSSLSFALQTGLAFSKTKLPAAEAAFLSTSVWQTTNCVFSSGGAWNQSASVRGAPSGPAVAASSTLEAAASVPCMCLSV
mmetsp:Transcript_5137/g.12972  ORF Transcript_5137/g.12972 Transcript_5137/m.12972 type:complete len:220 (+) Transcript_5137:384-1043(+)